MTPEASASEESSSSSVDSGKSARYRPILQLDAGGMADVYLALASGPAGVERLAVTKRLKRDLADDEEFVAMFLEEARLATRLNHPNVVHTYEVTQQNGDWLIAMEFLAGQSLARLRKKARASGGIPLALHLKILSDTLAGLEYAHRLTDFDGTPLRIVHRDVNPQNVFVGYDGQVKILDFGIAKAASSVIETRTGWLKGKLSYMAPEQVYAESVDRRADVFSVGAMLWEAVTGRRLRAGAKEITIMRRLLENDLPWLTALPGVPADLAAIYQRALAPRLADRHSSAAEAQRAIDGYLDRTGRRLSQRDVAGYMDRVFAEEQEHLQAAIAAELGKVATGRDSLVPILSIGPSSDAAPSLGRGVPFPADPPVDASTAPAGLAKTLPPVRSDRTASSRARTPWLPSLLVAVLLVAGSAWIFGGSPKRAAKTPAPPVLTSLPAVKAPARLVEEPVTPLAEATANHRSPGDVEEALADVADAPAALPAPAWADPPATTGAAPTRPQPAILDAQGHFRRALELYEEANLGAALTEMKRAYQIAPNYRILYDIGQIQFEMQNYSGALSAFEEYLAQGAKEVPAERRRQVEKDIGKLRQRIALLEVSVNVADAEVWMDDERIGTSPLAPFVANAGRRKLAVTKPGYAPVQRTIEVAGGDGLHVAFDLVDVRPAPARVAVPPPLPIVETWKPDPVHVESAPK